MAADFVRESSEFRLTAAAAVPAESLWQLPDGGPGVFRGLAAAALGDRISFRGNGQYTVPKATGVVLLDGGRAYWDRSAGVATFRKVNDRDCYLGRVVGDAASADATCVVNLRADPPYDIDLVRDAMLSVPVGTQAVGAFGWPKPAGGCWLLELSATNEAQKIDLLSVDRHVIGANAIVEAIIRIPVNGTGAAVDFNIGLANGTHATDADSITEYVFFHLDGAALDLFAQSKDGTTTVAATDTTVNVTEGSAVANRVELWIDCRDPASVKLYVDGVRVLSGTTFRIDNATGPLGLLAHLEKTTGTTTAQVIVDRLTARYSEQ